MTSPTEELANKARKRQPKEFHLWLDEPRTWTAARRHVRLSGWCVAQTGASLTAIRAIVDGKIFDGAFDRERADVAEHLGRPELPRTCGFGFDVRIPYGKRRLELQVARADGNWRKVLAREIRGPFRIGAEERNQTQAYRQENLGGDRPFFVHRPFPNEWKERRANLRITGWCFARRGEDITELRARVRGKTYRANYGLDRADVAAWFEGEPGALRSGFIVEVQVPRGPSALVLEARTRTHTWEPFFVQRIVGPLFLGRGPEQTEPVGNYAEWIQRYDRLTRRDVAEIKRHAGRLPWHPTFSVLMPVYNTNAKWLRRAIESVRRQLYPHWELCIVDDASTEPHVGRLLGRYARRDPRIKIHRRQENGHISAASNDALALATGEFVALLDHDDELAATALYFAALELNRDRDLQLIYSDEDKLDPRGRRRDPHFKTDWNPDLLHAQNYVSHLSIYSAALVRKVGGFREGFEGAQDYDLVLRATEQIAPAQIHHIPRVLYHWRIVEESTATRATAKPYAHRAAIRAVQEHFERRGIKARVEPHIASTQRVTYPPPRHEPLVSLIIPTRDRLVLLRQCIESIMAETSYKNFEIVVVDNESTEPETLEYLRSLGAAERATILHVPGEFNFSRLNNLGVAQARGEFVALLNNDVEPINADWLTEMLSHAARPEVGLVGARLWYPDGKLQHGGVVLGVGGIASHAHHGLREEHGYFARPHLTQQISAVTGACVLLRKDVYQQLGGLEEEHLAIAFNDIDFCLRVGAAGFRVIWTPHAELIHHESASRGLESTKAKQRRFEKEGQFMRERWEALLANDPFYDPNLSIEGDAQFKLAYPPRLPKPWREA